MAADPRRALVLVDQHTAGRESIWRGVWAAIVRILSGASSRDHYTHATQARAAREIADLVRAAQEATGDLTLEYLDAMLTEQDLRPPQRVEPIPQRPRQVDPVEEWLRPFAQFRVEYARSQNEDRARASALLRAEQLADMDLALAQREAARNHAAAAAGVIGYRRVIHPELSKYGQTCGLCLAASDRMYGTAELMPLHQGCNCTMVEVTSREDLGVELNGMALQDLYDAAGGTDRGLLQRVRYRVESHGELGPVLVNAGHDFRGPDEVAA